MSHSPAWVAVCRLDDIPTGGSRRFNRPRGMPIALFRCTDDSVFALIDRCPHKGGPLSQGIVFGHRVACPLHGWGIDLCNGQAAAPDEGSTASFAVRLEDGLVHLDQHEIESLALDLTAPVAGPTPRRCT